MKNYPLYIIIALSLSLLLIFTLVLPKYRVLDSLKQEILEREADFRSQEEYFQQLQGISGEVESYKDSFLRIESALPEDYSMTELFNFFQKVASQTGLILEEISPSESVLTEEERIRVNKISLGLIGSYFDFKNFLSIIEKSARLIEVDNISFSHSTKEELVSFGITTRVHSY